MRQSYSSDKDNRCENLYDSKKHELYFMDSTQMYANSNSIIYRNINLMLCAYEEYGKFIAMSCKHLAMASAFESSDIAISIKDVTLPRKYKFKTFIWTDCRTMIPLSNVGEFKSGYQKKYTESI